ncbi:unnamed protein product [Lasius platythorax]|uniref:Uncharacterized protein n=1 Tax=Lasius platythorax TaxID=488582 RepID=A0AAV2P0W5_9HYME
MNRGWRGGGEQDRPKDGVLWGFHGWCSREFAYRASVTSPLAPAPGHSRLGISPGADLRDNGDHSYGKSDGGRRGLPVIRRRATLRNCLAEAGRDITARILENDREHHRDQRELAMK